MPKRTKVYVTKQALTNGILVKFVDKDALDRTPFCIYDNESDISTYAYMSRGHVHLTLPEAFHKASEMKHKKLESLRAQLKALEEHEIKVIR